MGNTWKQDRRLLTEEMVKKHRRAHRNGHWIKPIEGYDPCHFDRDLEPADE